jgi:tRNA threonylcarbamoyladenosine modification (KEOPS) complex  Pcc1 subunit
MTLGSSSETRITIEYRDKETARAIQSAIEPDNITLPDGIHILTSLDGSNLSIEIDSERSIGSLVVTLDDLLSCIQAAEQTLEKL